MARSARYKRALQAMDAALASENALREENADFLSLFETVQKERISAEEELKSAAKEEAAKDKDFRGDSFGDVSFVLVENKEVDVAKLKALLPPATFKKLLSPMVEKVTVEKYRSALEMGLVDETKASGVLVSKGFAFKFKKEES